MPAIIPARRTSVPVIPAIFLVRTPVADLFPAEWGDLLSVPRGWGAGVSHVGRPGWLLYWGAKPD